MVWHHCCGWSGNESELTPFVYQGIVAGMECPGCEGDWPFFNDDDDDMFYNSKHVGEPDKCDSCGGAGERVSGYQSEGKLRVQPCRTCGGTGVIEIKQ